MYLALKASEEPLWLALTMIGREVEGNEDIRRGDRQEYGEKNK